MDVKLLVEGELDREMAEKLLGSLGIGVEAVYGRCGRSYIEKRIGAYNQAAKIFPWVVFIDLDNDKCAPSLVQKLIPSPSKNMFFRVVVRELEAWLLGDAEKFSDFFLVPRFKIPARPEDDPDPKKTLLRCIQLSKSRTKKQDLLPEKNSKAQIGRLYNSTLAEFIRSHWRPRIAARSCESLNSAIKALKKILDQ